MATTDCTFCTAAAWMSAWFTFRLLAVSSMSKSGFSPMMTTSWPSVRTVSSIFAWSVAVWPAATFTLVNCTSRYPRSDTSTVYAPGLTLSMCTFPSMSLVPP